MPLVIIILIIIVIAFVYAILRLILTAFFGFLFLLSTNALLFIEKCFFISNAIPPWVSWGIFGLIIGLVVAAYKEAPRYGKAHLRPLLIVFQIGLIGGLCLYNMNRLQGVHEATPQRYVEDRVSIISDTVEKGLNGYLQELEQKTGTQMIVLTINTTGSIPIETYAIELATKWKLGQKGKGKGVLVVIAKDDRTYRIEVGYGLEGILPDGFCGTVGKTYFAPNFRKGQFSEGIYQGVVILVNKIAEESGIKITGMPSMADMRKKANERQQPSSQEAVSNCFASVSPDRWKGEYFNNDNLQGSPSMIRDDGNGFIDFHWGKWSPFEGCGIGADNFSVLWTRTVSFDDGTYRFEVTGDDGVRLYIDDQLKLSRWNDQEATTYTTDVQLPAGKHTIRLEYYENVGDAIAKLSWQAILTPKQLAAQSPITYKLTGEWKGKVDDKKATLKITQDGNSLSGNIVYGNVTEFLSGEINNDQVVLKGTGYMAKGFTGFSLDTFQGMVSKDVNSINGNYTDEDGHSGTWFAKRKTTILTQESTANQNKKQQSKDIYEPRPAIPIHQVKLTNALQKRPSIVVKKWYRGKCDIKSTMAKLEMGENGDLTVQSVDISVECKWSSRESSYIGTWRDSRRTRGKVILRPIYNDSGEIKCFSGHLGVGNGSLNAVIKVSNLLCLCPDPPDHNPSTRDQYRKPKSPSVHTYETNRSYHWGK